MAYKLIVIPLPVLYSRLSLVIYFTQSSAYMSVPISQFIPFPLYPLYVHMFVLYVLITLSLPSVSATLQVRILWLRKVKWNFQKSHSYLLNGLGLEPRPPDSVTHSK